MKFGSPLKMIDEAEKGDYSEQSKSSAISITDMPIKEGKLEIYKEVTEKDSVTVKMRKEVNSSEVFQRRKARVGLNFKQKAFSREETVMTKPTDTLFTAFSDDDHDAAEELLKCESYFLRKIQIYKRTFEEEKAIMIESFNELEQLEKDMEESRISQLTLLMKVKEMKSRIIELEGKNLFYKNRLKKYEEAQPEG
ncbi:hypothetical protein GINT2_001826 [Glugoides intestinalis]